ncbi:putative F-box domain-containing protein [Seiridium unicorne]|uniref:F-box domain-containing protein n=1 Tax=Seiridium unicorne TaxID=138068 RepID=A0ABR2UHI1_9PEZI
MHPNNHRDWISQLSNDLLLLVFERETAPAALTQSILCCKRWKILATSVLYRHVALDTKNFSRWSRTGPPALDATIETFTLCVTDVRIEAGREPAATTMERLRLDLDRLPSRLRNMVQLRSLSIHTPAQLPRGLWIPESSMAEILHHVPGTCSSLEVDVRDSRPESHPDKSETHICVSIRRLMPQLQFLRLGLPCLCPASVGDISEASSISTPDFTPAEAPNLRECIIKLREPSFGASATVKKFDIACNSEVRVVGIKAFAECLQALVHSGRAPSLKKLWILDALPQRDQWTSFGALVRRDVLADKSQTLPWKNIAPGGKSKNGLLIRMPADEGGEDLLATMQDIWDLVEGHSWITASDGTRLPAFIMGRYRLPQRDRTVQIKEEWLATNRISTHLWADENETGMRLLHAETGSLLEDSPAEIHVPEGWRRDASGIRLERAQC